MCTWQVVVSDITFYFNDIELSTSDIININDVELATIELEKAYFRKSSFVLIDTSNNNEIGSINPIKLNVCSL